MFQVACFIVFALMSVLNAQRLAGECASQCNDLRLEVLTMEMCRDAKRTLPRPKVGDFCSNAMEQGYSDACIALCMNERPVPRVAQTCRAAAIEMPRPTVRRWCEHGYNVAFEKTISDLRAHFKQDAPQQAESVEQNEQEPEPVREEEPPRSAPVANADADRAAQQRDSSLRGGAARAVKATIPITVGEETKDLLVFEGQNAEDAVVVFCRENVPDDVSSCIRQLLPTVIEKLDESAGGN